MGPRARRFGFAVAALGECVYLVGGVSAGRPTRAAWRYDTGRDTFERSPDFKVVRRRLGAAAAEGESHGERPVSDHKDVSTHVLLL